MTTVFDIAKYILECKGEMSAMKLQKLAYYSQAWSLVWDEEPLFNEEFEAWANGPVVRELYNEHKGLFKVKPENIRQGNVDNLSGDQKDTVNKVLDFFGDKTAQWLSNVTHKEDPWKDARGDCLPMANCSETITKASMAEYYSAL